MERQLDATASDFLSALVADDVGLAVESDEITITDYIAEYERQTGGQIARSTAESRLEKRVRDGEMTKRMAQCRGRDVRAYRPVYNGTEKDIQLQD